MSVQDRPWMQRHPRLAGVGFILLGAAFVALQLALILTRIGLYVVVFPFGGMLMGLGTGLVITGHAQLDGGFAAAPWWSWAITIPLALAGAAAGVWMDLQY